MMMGSEDYALTDKPLTIPQDLEVFPLLTLTYHLVILGQLFDLNKHGWEELVSLIFLVRRPNLSQLPKTTRANLNKVKKKPLKIDVISLLLWYC